MARKRDMKMRSHEKHGTSHARRGAAQSGHAAGNRPAGSGPLTEKPPVRSAGVPDGFAETEPPVLKEVKKRRRRGRPLLWVAASRLVIVGLILAGGFAVWRNWENLAPDSLIVWVDELLAGDKGGEGYPVSIAGSTVLQMADVEGSLALLSDTSFTMLGARGGETVRRPHTYSDPMMKTAGKYALVAESGGTRLSLETRAKTVWTKTLEYAVVSACVSKNGTVAVITAAEQSYSCELAVYNSKGKLLYRRSRKRQAVDVALSPDGKRAAVASVAASGGDIRSYLDIFSFNSDSEEPELSKDKDGLMLFSVDYLNDGRLAAAGDTELWLLNTETGGMNTFGYEGRQLLGYAAGENTAAVVTQPVGSASGGRLAVVNENGAAAYTADFTGSFRHVTPARDGYLLLTGDALTLTGLDAAGKTLPLPGDGRLAGMQNGKAVVLGLTTLTQYALDGGS